MFDLQLIWPSAVCLSMTIFLFFLSFQSIDRSIVVRHRKCLVYTHTIRFINHAMVTMKRKYRKRKKIRSFYPMKKIQVLTPSINQPVFFFSFHLFCMCAYREKESILSSGTHRRKKTREKAREREKRLLDRRSIGRRQIWISFALKTDYYYPRETAVLLLPPSHIDIQIIQRFTAALFFFLNYRFRFVC
jgi:hypothetical protein